MSIWKFLCLHYRSILRYVSVPAQLIAPKLEKCVCNQHKSLKMGAISCQQKIFDFNFLLLFSGLGEHPGPPGCSHFFELQAASLESAMRELQLSTAIHWTTFHPLFISPFPFSHYTLRSNYSQTMWCIYTIILYKLIKHCMQKAEVMKCMNVWWY
jgi:hypothetical protein